MAADQERADRIRALKQDRPDLTWRRIADHVGVTERSATDWQKKGGIEYDNAKKLAELFEVDVDYLWRGVEPDTPTPSPFASADAVTDQLDRIEQRLTRIETLLEQLLLTEEPDQIDEVTETIRRRGRQILEGAPTTTTPDPQPTPERRVGAQNRRAKAQSTP